MKQLLIIGARGWGREIYNVLPDCCGYGEDYICKGFLDDKTDALEGMPGYPPIIDSAEHYEIQPEDVFICALGDVHWKKHYVDIILSKGGKFINIIHKSAVIRRNTEIGVGCIILDHVSISCDIKVGNFVTFQSYVNVGHDAHIGDFCHLGCMSFMGGGSELGDTTVIQISSIILPHIKVGNDCTVGSGSVVIRNVKSGITVFGNPAKKIDF